MGKVSLQSQPEPTINHFSHQHPLNLSNHQPQQTLNINQSSCSACKLNLSPGLIYSCKFCNYNLHISCAQMPQQINHQFHKHHSLSLLPKPAYPVGFFSCEACGKQGDGFSYHCRACKIDLHIKCASMPLKVSHQSHHHNLDLTFSNPYGNDLFSCDVCKNMGSKEWLYRCISCEFDCHLNCATMEVRSQVLGTQLPDMPNLMNNNVNNNNNNNQGVHGRMVPENVIMNQMMQQIATNQMNTQLQAMQLLNRGYGLFNGNGGGVNYLQPMLGCVPSGGINGGGGADILQAMMGGGGGAGAAPGADILQAMMGGGGVGGGGVGAGADILQAMMGGGGGGGAEILQAMMGGGGGGGAAGNILQTIMGGGRGGGGDILSGILGSLSGL